MPHPKQIFLSLMLVWLMCLYLGMSPSHICTVQSVHRECFEKQADLYLRIRSEVFDHTIGHIDQAYAYCGKVRDCQTSPGDCELYQHVTPIINETYYCYVSRDEYKMLSRSQYHMTFVPAILNILVLPVLVFMAFIL